MPGQQIQEYVNILNNRYIQLYGLNQLNISPDFNYDFSNNCLSFFPCPSSPSTFLCYSFNNYLLSTRHHSQQTKETHIPPLAALRSCGRQQIITNTGSKLDSIFEGDKSYGKKEKGVGRGIQDFGEQGKILDMA